MSAKNKSIKKNDKFTEAEAREYSERLASIRSKQQAFIDMGEDLSAIAMKRLWRRDYKTWAAFCDSVIGLKTNHVKILINSADFVKTLPKRLQSHIPSAKSAVALARLENPQRAEKIVTELAKEGPVTEAAIMERLPAPKPRPTPAVSKDAPALREPAPSRPSVTQHSDCPLCKGSGVVEKLDAKLLAQLEKLIGK